MFASVLNVKDAPYNAVGDGAHDDRPAIQAALNDLRRLPDRYGSTWNPYTTGTGQPDAIVWADPVRVLHEVVGAALIAPKATATLTIAIPDARPGDIVTIGPPEAATRLLVSGTVPLEGEVRLQMSNPESGGAKIDPNGWWAVAAGNGFRSGGPQMVPADQAFAPYPMASLRVR